MGVSALGKKLRSSTLFIENTSEELIGLLSINFDDSKYVDLAKQLIGLCHPDTFVETNFRFDETYKGTPASQGEARSGEPGIRNASAHPMSGEAVPVSSGETVNEALSRIFRDMDLEGKSLSQSQRLAVMERLERDGVFLLKGAVKDASGALGISQASVYRYLSRIRQE